MNTEEKQETQTSEKLNEELVFTEKERSCEECDKEKEIQLTFGLSTREEWERIIGMIDRHNLTRQEVDYVYGFYNREFKDKRRPGCGKCFVNIGRNLKRKWERLKQGQTE